MNVWYPAATRNQATVNAGRMSASYGWKLVVHTTESDSFTPSPRSYFGHQYWPHFTLDRDGQWWQHIPIDMAARALRSSRLVETNRGRAIQVECVGRSSADPDAILTDAQVDALRDLFVWLRQQVPIDAVALPAGAIPGSASARAPQRMTPAAWRVFSGVCAHRHVPDNDHWDSGAFDLTRLLPDPPTPTPPEDDDMKPYLAQAEGTAVYLIFPSGEVPAGVPTEDALKDALRIYGNRVEKVSKDFLRLHGVMVKP